ncbi:hypothetical protein BLA15945_05090 [Burkholderia lata]|uniref:Uncharacterized protein n=1 Tax=Burkholderia lata (strain ATCC 17760 / DSM 23089 / LMG 22485 / NCIMB 9086 / R18194 / 383) TaxID=482957 RepID=A0A6P2PCP0_BURL3|nr:hypothetical protein BLA15945_05090 [Burkholderia lata]
MIVHDLALPTIAVLCKPEAHQYLRDSRHVSHDNRNVAGNIRHQYLVDRYLH